MFELIYCSVAHDDISSKDIQDILMTSRKFNDANKVTGCLLYHDFEFVQILEGDQKIVQDLYANIKRDNRHSVVTLLSEGKKNERTFPGWSMAYHQLNNEGLKNIEKLLFKNNFIAFSELQEKPTEAVKLFFYISRQILES